MAWTRRSGASAARASQVRSTSQCCRGYHPRSEGTRVMRLYSRLAVAAVALIVACSPAAAPAVPTPAPAAPQAATGWDGVLATAKNEGKLVLSTHAGSGYEKYVELVKQALPDLTIDAT